jgi:hypothetical protein
MFQIRDRRILLQSARKRLTVCVTCGWAGRDNAALLEPTSSQTNGLKTRRLPPVGCTLCWAAWLNGIKLLMPKRLGRAVRNTAGNVTLPELLLPLWHDGPQNTTTIFEKTAKARTLTMRLAHERTFPICTGTQL